MREEEKEEEKGRRPSKNESSVNSEQVQKIKDVKACLCDLSMQSGPSPLMLVRTSKHLFEGVLGCDSLSPQ